MRAADGGEVRGDDLGSAGRIPPAPPRLRPSRGCGSGCASRGRGASGSPTGRGSGLEQGRAQVLHAARAAGPAFRADRPFDHLHVAVAPLLDALVEVDEPLGDQRRIGVAAVDRDEGRPGRVRPATVGSSGTGWPRRRGRPRNDVPDRWARPGPPRSPARAAEPAGCAAAAARIARARAAPRSGGTRPTGSPDAESSRSRNERNWSGVIVSRTSTWATSVLRILRTRLSRWRAVSVSPASSARCTADQLVAELLEPELVDLVDDDEQQLIVLGAVRPVRALDLEREQFGTLRYDAYVTARRVTRRWYVPAERSVLGADPHDEHRGVARRRGPRRRAGSCRPSGRSRRARRRRRARPGSAATGRAGRCDARRRHGRGRRPARPVAAGDLEDRDVARGRARRRARPGRAPSR